MASPQVFHNVAILGATGPGLGNAVINAFLSNPLYKMDVRFLYREEALKDDAKKQSIDKLVAKGAKGFAINEKDVNSIVNALEGVDLVVSTLGVPAIVSGAENLFIDAAAAARVKRFVTSGWGINVLVDQANRHPIVVAKDASVKRAQEKGLEWTSFLTGTWLEYIVGPFFGFDLSEKFTALVPEDGTFYFAVTSVQDVAKITSYAVHHPTSKNSTVRLAANSLSWNHLLQTLERAFGRKFEKTQKTSQQLLELAASLPESAAIQKFGLTIAAAYTNPVTADFRDDAFDRRYPEALPGVKFLTVEEYAHTLANKK